jgi:hypothetical protein
MTTIRISTVLCIFVTVALCQVQPTFTIEGVDGKSVTLSNADLSKFPHQTVKTTDPWNPGCV